MATEAQTQAAADGTPVNPSSPSLYDGVSFGSKEALDALFTEEFGIPSETPPAEDAPAPAAETTEDGKTPPKADAKAPDAEDPDLKAIREINARSRARREAFRKAREGSRAPAAAAPPVHAAPPAAKPPEPAPAAAAPVTNEVTKAVADVLAEIQKLAADDAAPAAEQTPKDERAAAILALQAKLDKIAETTTINAELQTKLDAATAKLAKIESDQVNRQVVERHVVETIKPILAELPHLRAHRPSIEEPRTAIELIADAAGRYLEKFKAVPDMQEIARRIEKKLAPAEAPKETPSTKSKTVSSKLTSPPAARSGPDKRTKEEVEADLDAWVASVT